MHLVGDLLRVCRVCRDRGLRDDLYASIAVERIGFRFEFLGAEFLDYGFRFRPIARIGTVRHQRAFDAGAADRRIFIGGDAVAAHQRRLDALIAQLPHDQAGFGVKAAEVNQIGAGLLDLGNESRIIFLAGVDAFVEHRIHAAGLDRLEGLISKTLTVGGLVVDESDLLALEMREDVGAGDFALLIVAAAGAEDVPQAALGDSRVGRRGCDLDDAVFLINFRCWNRHAGIVVADDELHAVAGKFVGDRDALLGIGNIIAVFDRYLLAEYAARRIDIGDGL